MPGRMRRLLSVDGWGIFRRCNYQDAVRWDICGPGYYVHVLCGVDEEAPPEDIKKTKEDGGFEASLVCSTDIFGR